MKTRIIAACITLLACAQAHAAAWTNGQQIIGNIIWKPGYHGLYVKPGTYHDPNPSPCPNASSNLYLLDPGVEQDVQTTNRLIAFISLAMAQGKTLYLWVDGCQNGSPNFTGVQIND